MLVGGAYGTLALARSLRRNGLDVWLIVDETRCASYSNAVSKVIHWCGPTDPCAFNVLEGIVRTHGLAGSILIPGSDADVRFVSGAHARLSALFEVLTTAWEQLQWACDKSLASQRAKEIGVGVPRVYERAMLEDPYLFDVRFPLVLKPSMRLEENAFTSDRGWRVDNCSSLKERYRAACQLVGVEHVLAQQMIPGGGECQLSYAGLWHRGEPVISMTATRLRQYPVEFGSTSTYVVTAEHPDVRAAAETFLRSISHHGLVEVEFKRDPRDRTLKLLDVNPRPWNWLGLADAAGVDLGGAICAITAGRRVREVKARPGVGWMLVSRDIVTAARSGRLRPHAILGYAASWAHVRKLACFSWADPIPGIVDLPATLCRMLYRRIRGTGTLLPH